MRTILLAVLVLALALPASIARAQSNEELKRSIEALQESQKRIERDLQEIKTLLRSRPAAAAPAPPEDEPKNLSLSLDGLPAQGAAGAKVVLMEFTDYQCPFCARYVRDTLPQIEKDYVKTGKVRYIVRDFPLEAIHPQAFKASEATHCAGDQGKYWEMHHALFANQAALGPADLANHAKKIGLDAAKFQACLDGGTHAARVRNDQVEGERAGIRGTPTFLLGVLDGPSSMRVLRVIRGAQPAPVFRGAIDGALATVK